METTPKNTNTKPNTSQNALAKKLVCCTCGIMLGIALAVFGWKFEWFSGLDVSAVMALGILACCIVWWVTGIFPEFVTALVMACLFIVLCGVPTETAFSSFASPTWWLLVAAFALGYGMQKTGLMKRMADAILRVFPNTFKMQSAGLIAAGTLIGPFIPSLSAKATMLAPLSLSISDSMGYERKSKQAEGLFLSMFTGLRNIGPAIISASIIGYGLKATLPLDVAAQFDMLHWFLDMLPWFIFVTVANYVAIVLIYGRGKSRVKSQKSEESKKLIEDVGETSDVAEKMTSPEKRMSVIIICCIICWITEPLHGIGSHIIAITAMVAMIVFGVVSPKNLKSNISWDSLIFIGCVLGLASVFSYLGIDEWIVASFKPVFEMLAVSPYLFIAGIAMATILLRFVIVSEMAYINIFMAFMVPISLAIGINPWVVGVSVYAVVNPWFVLYQNPIYMTAYYATEGKMVRQSSMAKYCAVYLAICLGGLMVSIPFWQVLGLVP